MPSNGSDADGGTSGSSPPWNTYVRTWSVGRRSLTRAWAANAPAPSLTVPRGGQPGSWLAIRPTSGSRDSASGPQPFLNASVG